MITIRVGTDEERQAVAQAVENGALAAALGVPFKVERVTVGSGGGGAGASWLTAGSGGSGATRGCGPGGSSGAIGGSSVGSGGSDY